MASDPINLRGIVLSSRDFKDKDKIISFLSSDSGVIDICVKGTSKTGSRLAAITVPFIVADIVISLTGNFYYLKDYSIVESNTGISASLEALTVASHFSKILTTSYIDNTNSRDFYELMVYSLFVLANNPSKYLTIYSAFNWRALNLLGFVIEYDDCMKCHGQMNGKTYFVNYKTGEIYCDHCFMSLKNNIYDFVHLNANSIQALNFFSGAEYKKLFAVKLDDETNNQLSDFTSKYLSHQLEGNFNSLEQLSNVLNQFKL